MQAFARIGRFRLLALIGGNGHKKIMPLNGITPAVDILRPYPARERPGANVGRVLVRGASKVRLGSVSLRGSLIQASERLPKPTPANNAPCGFDADGRGVRHTVASHVLPRGIFWEDLAIGYHSKLLICLVGARGFEPPTPSLPVRYSASIILSIFQ